MSSVCATLPVSFSDDDVRRRNVDPALNIILAKTGFECDKMIRLSTADNDDIRMNIRRFHRKSELCREQGGKNV